VRVFDLREGERFLGISISIWSVGIELEDLQFRRFNRQELKA
jgi:hypothetical protein